MKGDFSRDSFRPEKGYSSVRLQQGRPLLDADWNEQADIRDLREQAVVRDVIGFSGAPWKEGDGFAVYPDATGENLLIGPGRLYVAGLLCDNIKEIPFTEQPGLPGETAPSANGVYLAYLEARETLSTPLENLDISDPALPGPERSLRVKINSHIKLRLVPELTAPAAIHAHQKPSWWFDLIDASRGQARFRRRPVASANPADAKSNDLFGRESGLLRVEIHHGGPPGAATWKWSKSNGRDVAAWKSQEGHLLFLGASLRARGRPLFYSGQWVEITDSRRELRGEPGLLVRVRSARDDSLLIDADSAFNETGIKFRLDIADFGPGRKIRGWDQNSDTGALFAPASPAQWMNLIDDIEVSFGNPGDPAFVYRTGDYWLMPTRREASDNAENLLHLNSINFQNPRGAAPRYAPLAYLERREQDGRIQWSVLRDCREPFSALTDATLLYAGGSGQKAKPGEILPGSLQVQAVCGTEPFIDAPVRFKITGDEGALSSTLPETESPRPYDRLNGLLIRTDADGRAVCFWKTGETQSEQEVLAELLDANNNPFPAKVRFQAILSKANLVFYDAANANEDISALNAHNAAYPPTVAEAPLKVPATTQDALDRLYTDKVNSRGDVIEGTLVANGPVQTENLTVKGAHAVKSDEHWAGNIQLGDALTDVISIHGKLSVPATTNLLTFKVDLRVKGRTFINGRVGLGPGPGAEIQNGSLQIRGKNGTSPLKIEATDPASQPPLLYIAPETGYMGLGTDTPPSPLTVNGVIQSLDEGIRFPDDSIQTIGMTEPAFFPRGGVVPGAWKKPPPDFLFTGDEFRALGAPAPSWENRASLPLALSAVNVIAFAAGGNIFILYNKNPGTALLTYDPTINSWKEKYSSVTVPGVPFVSAIIGEYLYWLTSAGGYLCQTTSVFWMLLPFPPAGDVARTFHAGGAIANKIYILAGNMLGNILCYDTISRTWSSHGPALGDGSYKSAALGEEIHILGHDAAGNKIHQGYNPVQDAWTSYAPLPENLYNFQMTALNGKLYVIAEDEQGTPGDFSTKSATLEYDPYTDAWRPFRALPEPRFAPILVSLGDRLHVIGGKGRVFVESWNIYRGELVNWHQSLAPGRSLYLHRKGVTPVPGGGGVLSAANFTTGGLTLSWEAASSAVAPSDKLEYIVYYSLTSPLNTIEEIETHGEPACAYFSGGTSAVINLDVRGLRRSTSYWFNVIARDEDGNQAVYRSLGCTTAYIDRWRIIDGGKDGGVNWKYSIESVETLNSASNSRILMVSWQGYLDETGATQRTSIFNGSDWIYFGEPGYGSDRIIQLCEFNDSIYSAWYTNTPNGAKISIQKYDESNWSPLPNNAGKILNENNLTIIGFDTTLASIGAGLYAAWSERNAAYTYSIIAAKHYDGNYFSNLQKNNSFVLNYSESAKASWPKLINVNQNLFLCWIEENNLGVNQIRAMRRTENNWHLIDGGTSTGINFNPQYIAGIPSLASHGDKLYIAWPEQSLSNAYSIHIKAYDDSVSTWEIIDGGEDKGLNYNSTHTALYPTIAVHKNMLFAAWTEYDPLNNFGKLRCKAYDISTSTWSSLEGDDPNGLNTNPEASAGQSIFAKYNDTLFLIWQEGHSGIYKQIRVIATE